MSRAKPTPRYNVISLRISEDEWQSVQAMKVNSRRSVSSIMRDALTVFMRQTISASGEVRGRRHNQQ